MQIFKKFILILLIFCFAFATEPTKNVTDEQLLGARIYAVTFLTLFVFACFNGNAYHKTN